MLEGLFGNPTAEKVLLYLEQFGEGYAQAIADTFEDVTYSMAYRQLERLERGGILASRLQGRTRVFQWNPRSAFVPEVRALMRKALGFVPEEERLRYFVQRRRPRRTGKPA